MNKNLLIIGAKKTWNRSKGNRRKNGNFEKIAFVDDEYETTPNGIAVIGKSVMLITWLANIIT